VGWHQVNQINKIIILEKELSEYKRIKLVLTGGGTRGVYQIGAIKAIQETPLWDNVVSISGCSIGSINAAAISQYSESECFELWTEIKKREIFQGIDQNALNYYYKLAKASLLEDGVNINPFIAFFDEYLDESIIRQSKRELIFTTYNVSKLRQEYHDFKSIEEGKLVDYVMASSRLPFFKPVFINDDKYADGGIGDNQPYYTNLSDKHFDLVITIKVMHVPYYIPAIKQTNISFDEELIISPTSKLGNPLGFRSPSFQDKYQLGYKDTVEVFNAITQQAIIQQIE